MDTASVFLSFPLTLPTPPSSPAMDVAGLGLRTEQWKQYQYFSAWLQVPAASLGPLTLSAGGCLLHLPFLLEGYCVPVPLLGP